MSDPDQAAANNPEALTLLGERIQRAREAKGYTQNQLAKRLGIRTRTLNNWETERSAPRANRITLLAGVLNVPLLWLIAGAESPPGVDAPDVSETAAIEAKLSQAEALVNELSQLLSEIRSQTRRVQREFDGPIE